MFILVNALHSKRDVRLPIFSLSSAINPAVIIYNMVISGVKFTLYLSVG